MLQAAELGIGSCWVGYFNAQEIAEVLGLPAHVTVSALLPIGYAAEGAASAPLNTQYRDLADTVTEI